jgi:hypothetical protein
VTLVTEIVDFTTSENNTEMGFAVYIKQEQLGSKDTVIKRALLYIY